MCSIFKTSCCCPRHKRKRRPSEESTPSFYATPYTYNPEDETSGEFQEDKYSNPAFNSRNNIHVFVIPETSKDDDTQSLTRAGNKLNVLDSTEFQDISSISNDICEPVLQENNYETEALQLSPIPERSVDQTQKLPQRSKLLRVHSRKRHTRAKSWTEKNSGADQVSIKSSSHSGPPWYGPQELKVFRSKSLDIDTYTETVANEKQGSVRSVLEALKILLNGKERIRSKARLSYDFTNCSYEKQLDRRRNTFVM